MSTKQLPVFWCEEGNKNRIRRLVDHLEVDTADDEGKLMGRVKQWKPWKDVAHEAELQEHVFDIKKLKGGADEREFEDYEHFRIQDSAKDVEAILVVAQKRAQPAAPQVGAVDIVKDSPPKKKSRPNGDGVGTSLRRGQWTGGDPNTFVCGEGSFRLKAVLHDVWFSHVFLAEWLEHQGAQVVVKSCNGVHALHEGCVLRHLQGCDHVPRLVWADEWDWSRPHSMGVVITKPFGVPLKEHFPDRSLSTAYTVASLLLPILQQVHARQVIHYDVKPGNIVVCDGSLVLIDWGLSVFYDEEELRWKDEVPLGTAPYCSLDQLNNDITPRSDLQSLAHMMVRLAGLRLPWEELSLRESRRRYRRAVQQGVADQAWLSTLPPLLKDFFHEVHEVVGNAVEVVFDYVHWANRFSVATQ